MGYFTCFPSIRTINRQILRAPLKFSIRSNCRKPRTIYGTRTTEGAKDRKMGTEISRTRFPNSYFSVHIFLSDSSSSSNGLFGLRAVFCNWFRPKAGPGNSWS